MSASIPVAVLPPAPAIDSVRTLLPPPQTHVTVRGLTKAFGGVPHSCPYDRTKVVVLRQGVEGPHWNATFLDFALRVGFDARLCRPYRAQTKGRVESGIKYVRL